MNIRNPAITASIAFLLLAAGCGGKSPEQQVASAKEYLKKKDTKSAVIQLKNALQEKADFAEARFLLGTILLKEGNASGAEIEFRKALAAKHPDSAVVPQLAMAMLAQGQSQKVVDEYGKTRFNNPAADATLQTTLAAAYSALGKPELAQAALDAALAADPGYSPALLAGARQKAAARDFDGALAATEAVIAKDPTNVEAWKFKGDLLVYAKNKPDDAIAAWRKALEIDPAFAPAQAAILGVQMQRGNLDEASKQLEQLKRVAANSPQTLYLAAQLAFQKKDYKQARELCQQLLRFFPNTPLVLQLAGAIELQMNSLALAETYLASAVQAAPQLGQARRLLIMTYLRSGQPAKAMATLNAGTGKDGLDPTMLSLAGQVYLQNGDATKAEEYFARAMKLDPENAAKRTAVALMHLGTNSANGFEELQSIAASDDSNIADLALISAHLRRGEFDKAMVAIDKLEAKQPNRPIAANLRGRTQLALHDRAGARGSFEKALKIDPSYYDAVANLAALDMDDGKPNEAKKRFEDLLAKNPKNAQALMGLVDLAVARDASKDEVAGLLNKAIEANPTEITPRLRLIDLFLRNKDYKQAASAAQNAVATLPNSPEALDALGQVQQISGEPNQAIATFGKLAAMQPLSTRPLIRLSGAHFANHDMASAEQSLRKALEIKPDDLDAQSALIALKMEAKKFQDAITLARQVQQQRPTESAGYLMEGDIFAVQKDWASAIAALNSGLAKTGATDLAIKLHAATMASGKPDEAARLSATWLKAHPKDANYLAYQGESAILRGDYGAAEKSYLASLEAAPLGATGLNNLAWATYKLGKKGAVAYAERANLLAPNQPAFMDTLATLLAAEGQFARATELQTRALGLQPDSPLLKLNLAKIYIASGDKARAKPLLEALSGPGDKNSLSSEAQALLKGL